MKNLNWYIIKKEYIEYLKLFDNKVQNIDYNDKLKPYVGIVLDINNFKYYVPITSAKSKYISKYNNLDIVYIRDNNQKLLGVLNLNNMIPVGNREITLLDFTKLRKYRKFANLDEEYKYISFLSMEIVYIRLLSKVITKKAQKVYLEKINRPNSRISQRTNDFKLLEEKCLEYQKNKIKS